MEKPNIAILDLEWNAAYSRKLKGYINEVIQFGAVKCGPDLTPISTFTCYVRPRVSRHLNDIVVELTGIQEADLQDGMDFMEAVNRFRRWVKDCLIMTWGRSDILTLIENCRYFSGNLRVPFLSRYVDLQRYAEECLGLSTLEQAGLERVADLLDLDISQMEQHRALDDSLIALQIFSRLQNRLDLAPYIQTCDSEFYRQMTFRTSYIKDLQDPRVQAEHLRFACPRCGGKGVRTCRWSQRNHTFQADFRCKDCALRFAGRLILKQKYEGIQVNKRAIALPIIEKPRPAQPGFVGKMLLETKDGVGVLRFPRWQELEFITHAFSTRIGGVSKKEFAAMNLGYNRGDPDKNVEENYRRFAQAAGFETESMVCGCQVHGTDIRRVTQTHRGIGIWRSNDCDGADGLCTNEPGVTLVIFAADCVPVYFVDPEHKAIGLAHAGWRGAAAGMPGVMVRRMEEEFGSRPERILAAIGPSICKNCFEVDEPVAREFLPLPDSGHFVTGPETMPGDGGVKYHVDLWECCRRSLLHAGVLEENISVGEVCTMEESDLLFSHRKTRGQRGSNTAMLALRP